MGPPRAQQLQFLPIGHYPGKSILHHTPVSAHKMTVILSSVPSWFGDRIAGSKLDNAPVSCRSIRGTAMSAHAAPYSRIDQPRAAAPSSTRAKRNAVVPFIISSRSLESASPLVATSRRRCRRRRRRSSAAALAGGLDSSGRRWSAPGARRCLR